MNEKYFECIKELGVLYLGQVFVSYEKEPLIFTCYDENNNIYICLCSDDRFGQTWIIGNTDAERLNDLIDGKTDILDTFLSNEFSWLIEADTEGRETYRRVNTSIQAKTDLPESGVMLRCNEVVNKNSFSNFTVDTEMKYNVNKVENITIHETVYKMVSSVVSDYVNTANKKQTSVKDVLIIPDILDAA